MSSRSIPILTYHSIDDRGSVTSTTPSVFKKQMEFLWQSGYETLSVSEIRNHLVKKKPFPEKRIVITFDDGYRNNYLEAFPILQQFGFNATIFLIGNSIIKNAGGSCLMPTFESHTLLNWPEIKEMHKYGFEFGAHTMSHPDLTRIPLEQAEREIMESKAAIQNHLGQAVNTFAYSYGKFGVDIRGLVAKHYLCACTTILGKVHSNNNPFLLKRIDMYYLQRFQLFTHLPANAMGAYLFLRRLLRAVRGS